jgi:CubicO group peptidase (beta-lactamase class C family)
MTLADLRRPLERALRDGLAQHRIPGASIAIRSGDERLETAAGVINVETEVEATTDTLYLIGSITKVWTATLVMRLVDEGRVDLDAPVRTYLPDLRLADEAAAASITVRQLLSHTSGIDEDMELYTGRGDDCIERYVEACATLAQLHPPGEIYSYCNSGMLLAGRLVEVLTGGTYDEALRRLIVEPLGLERTVTLPEEALLHRAAVGHLVDADGAPVRTPLWTLPRPFGPAGSTICASAGDLVEFAGLHLDGGRDLLSADAVRAMQEPHADALWHAGFFDRVGLGWHLRDVEGERLIGHYGGNIGQFCSLIAFPDRRFAIAVLTNSFSATGLLKELLALVFRELHGLSLEPVPVPRRDPGDLARYEGVYRSLVGRVEVELRDGRLWVQSDPPDTEIKAIYAELPPEAPLEPLNEQTFVAPAATIYGEPEQRVDFLDVDGDGRPEYIHVSGYALRRQE